MKKTILTLSLIAFSQLSFAQFVSGAQALHTLECTSVNTPILGIQVRLGVITQALAPQASVRSIFLSTKPVVPNAKETKVVLNQKNQNAYHATFAAKGVKVLLDKSTFEATLNLGQVEYSCK